MRNIEISHNPNKSPSGKVDWIDETLPFLEVLDEVVEQIIDCISSARIAQLLQEGHSYEFSEDFARREHVLRTETVQKNDDPVRAVLGEIDYLVSNGILTLNLRAIGPNNLAQLQSPKSL